ncbi:Helicase protein MOM1 [Sesamum alatum]|uniref:Helicase protein MOM1 n=1 Tax=Sesamum alatum TaxID=300844 RepID=A0AAE1YFD4_9LAMI|nr:Helicase protein MOM1 [Sesamum alatum]
MERKREKEGASGYRGVQLRRMVSDTRSSRKVKDADGNSSKKNINVRKDSPLRRPGEANVSGVRRSARETSSSRQMTPSPQSMRKSKRLDKGMPPLTPPVKRKSERLEKCSTPSPLRRSDRGKKNLSSSSSGSKQSAKDLSLPELKRKKEKDLIQVTMESEKAELDSEAVRKKRKKMNARTFKALFKRQRTEDIVPDGDGELEEQDKLYHLCSDNSRGIGSEPTGNGKDVSHECRRQVAGKLRDESIDKASGGTLLKSTSSLKGSHAEKKSDVNVDSSHRDNVSDEPSQKNSQSISSVRETFLYSERSATNCSSTKNVDAPESESSTCLARSQDGSGSSNSSEKYLHPKEGTLSPLAKFENCNPLGTCVLCSKNRRVGYDSPEQELCSCSYMVDNEQGSFYTCKDRNDHGAAVTSESAERSDCRRLLVEKRGDSQMDGHENVCAVCNKDGELLCCVGKSCKRCYHLFCLEPPLADALPGVWHCPQCVKKKLLFGVHSVSDGVESIWDVREVEVSNGVRQRQYLVKYHGLAHTHNHWVPEKQLLLENPCLVSSFMEKDQIVRWSAEWTVPDRLLRKRPIQDKVYIASSAVISVCNFEWLVKWRGLTYDHATWELDNASFLSSSLGQNLMNNYEIRRRKAKQGVNQGHKGSISELPELPVSGTHVNDNVLKNVNKLRECLFKCQNAVVFDDQERAMTVTSFIESMKESSRPFLIVTASGSLSQWEAEFAQLVPSVDVVVYNGNKDTRKGIRASEFYEGGQVMLQVLLSSAEAVLEDLDIVGSIRWEAIVIDDCQQSWISNDLEQIKMLRTNLRIVLVSCQMKDQTSEYLKILSLLESNGDFDKLRGFRLETNDNLCKLKDRLSRFIAYGSTSQVSKFIEYWVPVQISNYQLEQYCATLLSNSIPLRSCSRNHPVRALHDILLTVRKCCDHPYLLDPSVQERLFAEQRPAAELLDIGIEASGKLKLLDTMLTEIKTRGLRVLILFQLIIGSGGASTGDILDDFLRQRFGQNTYERIDAGVIPSKKQAAVNRFNKKETGQFVFLLENRACSSIIKLSSLDIVVIYDSGWNPANDLRALQKISVDSKAEQIKVFRLYSSFTVEERALLLAKQNLHLDNNSENFSWAASNSLLSWGALHLFNKLEEYHADSNSTSALNFSSGHLLLNKVTKEFQAILSESCEDTDSNAVISKVKLGVGSYSSDIPMLGEAQVQLTDGEEPHIFWKNLLDGKNPQWKHLREPCPRNRKRVHYLDGSPSKPETEKVDVVKKRKKLVNENLDPTLVKETQVAVSKGGPSTARTSNQSQIDPTCMSGGRSVGAEVSAGASDKRIVYSDDQKSLQAFLQGEMTRLCQILKLSEDVTCAVRKLLEYVIKNHHVNSDSPSIVQAFQISLCWIAASIAKEKVDKKNTLMLAKQLLDYQCTEEQANSVYLKMRSLKRMYLQCPENIIGPGRDGLLAEEDTSKGSSKFAGEGSLFSLKMENGENCDMPEDAERHILLQKEQALKDKAAASEIDNKIKKIQRKCDKRMKKLIQKHQEEIQEFHRIWEEKRVKLETDHKLESAFIRSIHSQGSVRMEKLKLLDNTFAKKMEEHHLLKYAQLKVREAEQLAAINEERHKAAHWLAKAKACSSEPSAVNGPPLGSQSEDDVGGPQPSTHAKITGPGNVQPMFGKHVEDRNPSERFCAEENNVPPSITSTSTPAEALGCGTSGGNLVSVNSQNEVGLMFVERSSAAMVEHPDQPTNSSNNGETGLPDLPAPVEHVSDVIQSVDLSGECQLELPKTVPSEVVEHVHPVGLSNASKNEPKRSKIALADDSVGQKDGPDGAVSGGLQNSGELLVHSEKTVVVPDCDYLLPQQVQEDKMDQSLVSAELQDLDAPAGENESTSQIEVETSEHVDTVIPLPSNLEAPAIDDILTTIPSNHKAPVTENTERLHSVSVVSLSCNQSPASGDNDQGIASSQTVEPGGIEVRSHNSISQSGEDLDHSVSVVSLSCNQSPATEDNDQGIPSSQTVEPGGIEVLSHNSISQSGENLEIHGNHLDIGPVTSVARSQSVEVSATPQNDVAIPQAVVTTAEQLNQAVLPLGIDSVRFLVPSYHLAHPTHQPTWNSSPCLVTDPLVNELERIRKETELLEKNHEDTTTQLKSDCEKEIQEIINQIRNKYEVKLQESEAAFRLKRNELDKNQNKVLMNKILAEAFRSKCLDVRPPGLAGAPSSFMQHLHQVSLPPPPRSSHLAPACQPAPRQQITTSAAQTMQQLPPAAQTMQRPRSVRPSQVVGQNVAAPPVQAVQNTAALFSGTSSRPPVISAITPARNPRVGGEIRSRAPHLQPFRPSVAATSVPVSQSVSQLQPEQMLPSQPVQPPPPPRPLPPTPRLSLTNLVSQNGSGPHGGLPTPPNPSPSTVRLVMDMDHQPPLPRMRTSSPLPEICSTFRSLELSDLESLGDVQGNQTSAVATDVVCLSDDD